MWGMGLTRVQELQPVPVPICTLPVTRTGSQTRDNHYACAIIQFMMKELLRVVLERTRQEERQA